VTKSFTVTVGTTPTPLVAPDWVNPLALPFATQTASFSVTAAMLGLMVQYNATSVGTVTIPQNLTAVIGASVLFGQAGAGTMTVAGGGGVTIVGQTVTYGVNHVLRAVQTSLNVWTVSTYSWALPKLLGNPNGQPLLVAYGQITFNNQSAAGVLVDPNPNIVSGGAGTLLGAQGAQGASFTKYYGNAPAELWYGIVATGTAPIGVVTGPPWG
jgi:hypothetical protein